MTPYREIDLIEYWKPDDTKPLYMNQCWLISDEAHRNLAEGNFTESVQYTISLFKVGRV